MINHGNNTIDAVHRNSHLISMISLGSQIIFENGDFDTNNILFNIGIASDLHLSTSSDSSSSTEYKIKKFAQLVNSLNKEANNKLNFMATCGDYTSSGCYPQALTFASATKKILEAINNTRTPSDTLKFAFCYGNHDTSWIGQMPISVQSPRYTAIREASKKSVTLKYINARQDIDLGYQNIVPGSVEIRPMIRTTGVQPGPTVIDDALGKLFFDNTAEGGSYSYSATIHYDTGKITNVVSSNVVYEDSDITFKYYTSSYFHTWEDVLIDAGLLNTSLIPEGLEGEGVYVWQYLIAENKYIHIIGLQTENYAPNTYSAKVLNWLDTYIGTLDPNLPCFILSHAPIMESKVFGADPELEANAGWAATDNGLLDNVLKKYSNVYYFSGHTHYLPLLESNIMSNNYTAFNVGALSGTLFSTDDSLDTPSTDTRSGYSSALLVQLDKNYNLRIKRILMDPSSIAAGDFTSSTVDNPCINELDTYPTITQVITNSISLGDINTSFTHGRNWNMPTNDLITYSKKRGLNNQLTFDNPEFTIKNASAVDKDVLLSYQFKTATSNLPINCYKLLIEDQQERLLATKWMTGNWNNVTTGVIEGTSHADSTRLGYDVRITLNNKSAIFAKIKAFDVFGNAIELAPTQDCMICTSNASNGLFNATSDTCDIDLRTTGYVEYSVYFSNLKQRYSSNFKIEFDLTSFGGSANNVRMSFSPGISGEIRHRLMFQDGSWYTNPNNSYAHQGSCGFNLRYSDGSNIWTEESPFTMHCIFTYENGVAKLATDKNSTIFEYNIKSTYGDKYNNFVIDPVIIVRTAYFRFSNIVITNLN